MEAISEKFHHLKFCAKNQWEEYRFRIRHEIRSSGNFVFSAYPFTQDFWRKTNRGVGKTG